MGKKTLFWSHGVYGNESGLKRLIRVTFYRMADGMLLYGDYSKKLLIDLGMDPRSLEVIYNSLDYSKQKELRDLKSESCVTEVKARLFGSGDLMQPYLIFVGRLTSVKRLDLLLKAVAKLKQRGRAVNCLIVGEGPEAEMLYHLTESLGIVEQVNFYGASHDEEELSELIYSADLCVAPGNVGLTAMHALVYGTPVLTHGDKCWQMPEFEAIIAGVNGNFFERDDLDDLVDKADALLKTCADDRSMMRTACYKIIDEKYNPSYQSQVIRQMINRR
jgi:glycosyltransferase involved in cell wall biosynthesis